MKYAKLMMLLAMPAALSSACATTWGISQATLGRPPFDENVRTETVPIAGVREQLDLVIDLARRPDANAPQPGSTQAQAPSPDALGISCRVTQEGKETLYRASTRYGTKWKYLAVASAILEGGFAAAYLLKDEPTAQETLGGWFLAGDALGSAILAFVPSRDVYKNSIAETSTLVRSDCPEGVALEVGGRVIPIDATGALGDIGDAVVKTHLEQLAGPLFIRFGEQRVIIPIAAIDRCEWGNRIRHPDAMRYCQEARATPNLSQMTQRGQLRFSVVLPVPLGTFIGL